MNAPELRERIHSQLHLLSPSEKKLAHLLLAQGTQLSSFAANELAAMAGVSAATTARFFRRIGFASFDTFRKSLRETALGSSPLQRTLHTPARKDLRGLLATHKETSLHEIKLLHQMLESADVQPSLDLLLQASQVWVLGYRASYLLAQYAQAQLSQLRGNVFILTDTASRESEMLAQLDEKSLLVVLDMRRRTKRLEPLCKLAKVQGTQILLITDDALSPMATLATETLVLAHNEAFLFDSQLAGFALLHFLASAYASQSGRKVQQRLQSIENLHQQLGDLEEAS